MEAVKGLMDNILAEREEMKIILLDLAQDTQELYDLLKISQRRADDFTDDMRFANWKGWGTLLRKGKSEENDRRVVKCEERCRRQELLHKAIHQRKALMDQKRGCR